MTKVKSTKPTSSTIDKKPSAEVDNEMEVYTLFNFYNKLNND